MLFSCDLLFSLQCLRAVSRGVLAVPVGAFQLLFILLILLYALITRIIPTFAHTLRFSFYT